MMLVRKEQYYDKERCICELFSRQNFYDHENDKNYLKLKKLYEYAKILNIYTELRNVFEAIGWN